MLAGLIDLLPFGYVDGLFHGAAIGVAAVLILNRLVQRETR